MKALTLRKINLTAHVGTSVGWFGAVLVFIAIGVVGINSNDEQVVRASYLAMEIAAWSVIVPTCILSLVTGVVQSYITKWGLIQHYWVALKLVLTVLMTGLLLLHLGPISQIADMATSQTSFTQAVPSSMAMNMIVKAVLAAMVLLFAVSISILKPWGKLPKIQVNTSNNRLEMNKKTKTILIVVGIALVLLVIVKHILDGGMAHH